MDFLTCFPPGMNSALETCDDFPPPQRHPSVLQNVEVFSPHKFANAEKYHRIEINVNQNPRIPTFFNCSNCIFLKCIHWTFLLATMKAFSQFPPKRCPLFQAAKQIILSFFQQWACVESTGSWGEGQISRKELEIPQQSKHVIAAIMRGVTGVTGGANTSEVLWFWSNGQGGMSVRKMPLCWIVARTSCGWGNGISTQWTLILSFLSQKYCYKPQS